MIWNYIDVYLFFYNKTRKKGFIEMAQVDKKHAVNSKIHIVYKKAQEMYFCFE